MERLLTIKEVSEILHFNTKRYDHVYGLVNEGKLTGAKFGNKWLFKESDVSKFIDNQFALQNKKTF